MGIERVLSRFELRLRQALRRAARGRAPGGRSMSSMTGGARSRPDKAPDGFGASEDPPGGSSKRPFQRSYPAVATSVRVARVELSEFAREVGLPAAMVRDVELAVSEAATNIVVHAYRDRDLPGTIEVTATVAADELWVIITDLGVGLQPRPDSPGLGLGLAVIAQVASGIDLVRPAAGGLELRMRFDLAG
jgi:serine/threonine-protein kinase RsbW